MSDILYDLLRYRVRSVDTSVHSLSQLKSLIEKDIESKEKQISSERIKLKASRGLWKSDKQLVEVIVNKNINHLMVSTINSIKYLRPFEALYLMQNHCLEVLFDSIPLSIEESFKLFLRNENQMNIYRIFAILLRSGYFVKRHISPQICELKSNLKRKLSDSDIDCNKQLNTNYYELTSKISNYKFIKNIGPIDPKIIDYEREAVKCPRSSIYEIEESESAVELDPSLTLFNGSIKPLCDLGYLYSNDELFNLIQSFGPKTMNTCKVTESELSLTLDVFRHTSKTVDRNPNFSLNVIKADEKVPQIYDIMNLQNKSPSNVTYFAVLDSTDFVFYSVSCCQLNQELPLLWQKYLKPLATIR